MQHILDVNLPEMNPQGAPGGDYQNIPTDSGMFGGITSKALGSFGSGLERAGNAAVEIATEQNQLENKVHATDVKSWYADETTKLHTQFMSLAGRSAQDALPDYKKKLGDLRDQALEKVPGQATRAMLGESLTNMQDQYFRYWSGHAGGQLKTYSDRVAANAIASSSALAVNSLLAGDEKGFDQRLREQDVEVHNFYGGQGYDTQSIDAEAQKRRGATLKTAIETVAAGGDVGKAQALFDRYRDRMDPASVLQVTANLKSGIAQITGRSIADEESGHVLPKADSVAGIPSSFVAQIKRTEGFAPKAAWDYKQFTNGYGTRAQFEGEQIDRDEADRRFNREVGNAAAIVDKVNPNLDPGTKAALTSLTFNAGADWTHAGLGDAIRAGDLDKAKALFLQYNKAGGETNEGLVNRRWSEAQWFGQAAAPVSNAPLADKQSAYERVLARTDSNPLVQTAAISRLNQVYGIYHAEQASNNAAFDLRMKDTTAESLATGTAQNPLNEADFVKRYGVTDGQRRYGEYQKDLALGADISGLAQMSPEEQAQVLGRHTPQPGSAGFSEEQSRQQQVAKAIGAVAKERDADPAAFAIRRLPAAKTAFAEFTATMQDQTAPPDARRAAAARYANVTLAEQARVGVASDARSLVPQAYVDNLASRINNPGQYGGSQAVSAQLAAEGDLWGGRWPDVSRKLNEQLQPMARVIGAGVLPGTAQDLELVNGASFEQIMKDQSSEKGPAVKRAVLDAFKPLALSLAGSDNGIGVFNDFRGQAEKLAAKYVMDGMTAGDAAQKAFNGMVGFKYIFQDGYRIPKKENVDRALVTRGTWALLHDMKPGDLAAAADNMGGLTAEYLLNAPIQTLRRDGKWVTANGPDMDEKGLFLSYNGQVQRRADGQPFFVSWSQLEDLGRKYGGSYTQPAAGHVREREAQTRRLYRIESMERSPEPTP